MKVLINDVKYVPFIDKGNADALDVSFWASDIDEQLTVREYFHRLLSTLWHEEDGFSGKRPFGNSCWQLSMIYGLIESGFIAGNIERDDELLVEYATYNEKEANEFIQSIIARMCLGE